MNKPRRPSMTEVLTNALPLLQLHSAGSQYICDNVRNCSVVYNYKQEKIEDFWLDGVQTAWYNLAAEFGLEINDCQQFREFRLLSTFGFGVYLATEESQFARALLCTFMLEFLKDNPEFEYA